MYLHHKQNVTELHLTLMLKASSLWHRHPKVQQSTSVDIINPVHTLSSFSPNLTTINRYLTVQTTSTHSILRSIFGIPVHTGMRVGLCLHWQRSLSLYCHYSDATACHHTNSNACLYADSTVLILTSVLFILTVMLIILTATLVFILTVLF